MGSEIAVWAARQGAKTGPQWSSSSDRNFLAAKRYEATRRTDRAVNHNCGRDMNIFCFVCEYEISKLRKKVSDTCRNIYRECDGSLFSSQDDTFAPDSVC